MMSCSEFAKILSDAADTVKFELVEATDVLMEEVAGEAKRVIGTYEYGWPELAEATQEDRVARGFPANEPLLRTRELRDSIRHRVATTPDGAEGIVYSDEKKALWAELGTHGPGRGQPPRSFLFKSLWLATPAMGRIFGGFAEKLFSR